MLRFYCRLNIVIFGVIIGIFLGKLCSFISENNANRPSNLAYDTWFNNNKLKRKYVIWDTLRYNKNAKSVIESDYLFNKIPITCLILLRNEKNEIPIRNTWAKGCNEIKFIKIPKQKNIPLKRNLANSSFLLLCRALHDIKKPVWVFIVTDYTFVIMENLRHYLAPLIPDDQYYLGHNVKFWTTFFNSKEAGIVLSRGTLVAFKNSVSESKCSSLPYQNREGFYLGNILATLGIKPNDTRDDDGFSRFHPFNLYELVFDRENHKMTNGFPFKCCSKYSISFQALDGDKMYTYYYLLYTVQLFTHGKLGNIPNLQENDDEGWKTFLKERNITKNKITSSEYYKIWESFIDNPNSFAEKMRRDIENGDGI